MSVAGLGQRHALAEPVLLPHLQHLVGAEGAGVASHRKRDLFGSDENGVDGCDEAHQHRPCIAEGVEALAENFLPVRAHRGGRERHHDGVVEIAEEPLPRLGHVVVSLIHEDHLEVAPGQLREPPVARPRELLNVGDDDVCVVAVVDIRAGLEFRDEWPALRLKDSTFAIKAVGVRHV